MVPAEIDRPVHCYSAEVYLAALAAFAAAALLPSAVSGNLRTAIAGDIGAIVYLVLGFRIM